MTSDLAQRAHRGVMWTSLGLALNRGSVFVTTMVLARLLEPAEFGLIGIGLLVIGYLEFVNDFGVSTAVIAKVRDDPDLATLAYWLNIVIGVAMTAVGWIGAPLVADLFDADEATAVVRALSIVFILRSFGAIHAALLRQALDFRRVVVPETAKAVTKAVTAIVLALAGFGAWSLVWSQLAGAAVGSLAFLFVSPWQPSAPSGVQGSRRLLGFGSQITLLGLLGWLNKNIDYLLVGRRISVDALGVYTLAFRLPQLLFETLSTTIGRVAFPAFSEVQHDRTAVRRGLTAMLRLNAAIVVPLGVGLALVAEPAVELMYGSNWGAAVAPLRWLSLALAVVALSRNIGDVYKGQGRGGLLNAIALLKLVVTVPLLWIALPHGLEAVALAQLGAALLLTPVRLVIAARILGAAPSAIFATLRGPCVSGAVMALVVAGVGRAVASAPTIIELTVPVVVGAVSYGLALWGTDRDTFVRLVGIASPRSQGLGR